LKLIFTDCEKK